MSRGLIDELRAAVADLNKPFAGQLSDEKTFRQEEEAWTDDDWARDFNQEEEAAKHKDDDKI